MIGAMKLVESLIVSIQAFSASSTDLSALNDLLKGAEESLRGDADLNFSTLDQLDPSNHSLGYLFFLEVLTSGRLSREKTSANVPIIVRFIKSCDAGQIRLAEDKFVTLCKRLKEHVLELGDPLRGVGPLLTAIHKLQVSTKRMTALHPDLLQLCMQAKWYKTGFSILSDDIFEFDQLSDFFLYCDYGVMICIELGKFQKALELLYNVVMHLVNENSHEAYKKYILLSLIVNGLFCNSLPDWASIEAQRNFKNMSGPYVELGNCYNDGKIVELKTLVLAYSEFFEMDKNLGIAEAAVSSLYNRNILSLAQKYMTLSLQDIANRVNFEDAEQAETHLFHMIQDAQLNALIDQRDGKVRFLEDIEQYKTSETTEIMDSLIQRAMRMSKNLVAMNESLSCEPLYLENVRIEREWFDLGEEFSRETTEILDSVIQRAILMSKNLVAMNESLSRAPLYLEDVERERQRYDSGYSEIEDQQDENLAERPRQRRRYDSGEDHQDQNLTQRQP